ncbi:kinesin-like protein KIF24 isoform X2 [Stylophora pistillata]|uniref:Kinesin-like protein n=1 Tax=Stylophora pistillata TaxID=50429 RepID=A0A2B4STU3_STYPI|nr:kinesin-like protein KIF24 isoform X2 [Stylophora pistillata]PFX31815.1 Kinesin-like protein KIF24 [Stylophora pistillata]
MTNYLSLYECLQQVSLEKYHGKFLQRGIVDVDGMLSLTMQDYPSLGISSMADRQNLFYLIQSIKTLQPDKQPQLSERQLPGRGRRDGATVKEKDKKVGAKRPREVAENSPVAVKIKSKAQPKTSGTAKLSSLSRLADHAVNTQGFYNYGVPSYNPKQSPNKRHHSTAEPSLSRIQVCVRKRPLSQDELEGGEDDVVTVISSNTVELSAPKVAVDLTKYIQKYQFVFDEAFDEGCSNKDIYERTAKPLIKTVFNRGKATCFAYGCTGSGKTYTMLGNNEIQGIYVLAASEIFSILHNGTYGSGMGLWISFYEIYCGQLFDLLNERSRLFAREDGNHQVCITGLTQQRVHNVEELMEVIEYGGSVRSTGATGVNADSSRSHAILQLEVKVIDAQEHIGRFSFIDLAGNERAADVTDTDKQTRVEGAEINQSLLALKECIRALDLDSKHTPFRQSKLTRVLKDSFVGNCQTCMIANISPTKSCSENTLNTLRYADRVKELKKDTPGAPSSQLLTISTATPGTNSLLPSNGTSEGLPRMDVKPQSTKGGDTSTRGTPRNLDVLQPKTSCTTTSSPRIKDSVVEVNHRGNPNGSVVAVNVKRRLVRNEPSLVTRPHTSPETATMKDQSAKIRPHLRSRASSSKGKSCSDTQIRSNCLEETSEEKLEDVVLERSKEQSTSDILVLRESRLGFDNISEEAWPSPFGRQSSGKVETTVRSFHADVQGKESSPPSRNNRYGSGIKVSPTKLFSRGNVCNEEGKKVIESQKKQVQRNAPYPPQEISESDSRDVVHSFVNQNGFRLSLDQEQLVASHHTQLATVTGFCQEEMVLLKQINSGTKNFKDYTSQLNEILKRKVASIENLQEKVSTCLAE